MDAEAASETRKITPHACTQCRRVKMKCLFREDQTVCERCIRLRLDCLRERHRRGRKVGTRLVKRTNSDISILAAVKEDSAAGSHAPTATPAHPTSSWTQSLWADADGFQPPDLLNKPENKGRLSLQAILNGLPGSPAPEKPQSYLLDEQPGPVTLGIVNRAVARSLFEDFMRHFNPWICQFDPALHTFEHICDGSPLLFTAILASAARAFNPTLREPLLAHTQKLLARSLVQGPKCVELAHAILVITSWKEPEDTRAWMLIGHAIRMAHELGWQRLQIKATNTGTASVESRRKQRDIERVWLLLFVYDRSLSFQTGNPWMIERSELFLEARDTWYDDPLATDYDRMLCALLDLRLLTSDTFRPSHPKHRGGHDGRENKHDDNGEPDVSETSQFDRRGSLVRIISMDVDRWQRRCLDVPAIVSGPPCHRLLVRLYSAHLRLLLASSPLEATLAVSVTRSASKMTGASLDKRALWLSFASAVDMLNALSDPSVQPALYFAYDSIHVETAYAAAFLVKLCLRLPLDISSELEPAAQDALRRAREAFAQQAAPSNTVCALQAAFLGNIFRVLEQAMRARRQKEGEQTAPHELTTTANEVPPWPSASAVTTAPGSLSTTDLSPFYTPANCGEQHYGVPPDDDTWAAMFTSSGFSIDSGTFMPNALRF